MGIQDFPVELQSIIQQGFLEREFRQPLTARLGYRAIADREPIQVSVGETVTKTRRGLLAVSTTPLNPASNTNFDNGMTLQKWGVEQFTITMDQYGIPIDLNTVTDRVGIARKFVQNAMALGENAFRTLDTLARNALYATYVGGNTRVTATLGAPATTIAVDDVRGFQYTWDVAGKPIAISPSNTMAVLVNGTSYTLTGVSVDGSNTSSIASIGGKSGTLTFSTNVSIANGTVDNAVVASLAPVVLRPNARATTKALTTGDTIKMVDNILAAKSIMADNGVPTVGGFYNAYLSNMAMQGLFKDDDFKLLYRGAYGSREYKEGDIVELLGVRFLPTNMAPVTALSGKTIHRTIVCGAGALIEGEFDGAGAQDTPADLHLEVVIDGIRMITREPVDRLKQIISQAWNWVGGYCVPSDITANPNVIPTANNSAFKRAIVIESL